MDQQIQPNVSNQPPLGAQPQQPVMQQVPPSTKKSNLKVAKFLMIAPFAGLIGVLVLFAVANFIMNSLLAGSSDDLVSGVTGLAQQSSGLVVFQIINAVLGLLGVLSVLGVIIAFPMGLIIWITEKYKI